MEGALSHTKDRNRAHQKQAHHYQAAELVPEQGLHCQAAPAEIEHSCLTPGSCLLCTAVYHAPEGARGRVSLPVSQDALNP